LAGEDADQLLTVESMAREIGLITLFVEEAGAGGMRVYENVGFQ
jgi:hypothetical protein